MSADPAEELPSLPLEKIKTELAAAELAAGPADTTAYHDFHAVQLAYPDVWAEGLSESMRDRIQDIYDAAVRVADDSGLDGVDDILMTEIEDLEDFIRDTSDRVEAVIEASAAAIHPDITSLFPTIESQWHLIRPEDKRWIEGQIAVELVVPAEYRAEGARFRMNVDQVSVETLIGLSWRSGHRDTDSIGFATSLHRDAMNRALAVERWYENVFLTPGYSGLTSPSTPTGGDTDETMAGGLGIGGSGPTGGRRDAAGLLGLIYGMNGGGAGIVGRTAQRGSSTTESDTSRLQRMLRELAEMLGETYSFEYFEENSYNFGIVTTYRQEWVPGSYQVGDMVATVPLAPGERRLMEVRENIQTTRATKEMERASMARSSSRSHTARMSEQVIRRAQAATNFTMNSQGSFSIGAIGQIQVSSGFSHNQSSFSQSTKDSFRESVVRASHEYRNEHSLEVSTGEDRIDEVKTTAELSNPNNEVPVTYLLYELERQFQVTEKLHRLQPVIMVAQPMPKPDEINEAWLMRHEWILRRVLLDDSLRDALHHLHNSFAAEEVGIEVVKANWETQVRLIQKIESEHSNWLSSRNRLQDRLVKVRAAEGTAAAAQKSGGLLYELGSSLAGFDPLTAGAEELAARAKALEEQLEWANREIEASGEKLTDAQASLNKATQAYSESLKSRTQQRALIDQLRIHVKDNILYYMQAIWSHEPSDQRYFRLHEEEINVPQATGSVCSVREATPEEGGHPFPGVPGRTVVIENCEITGIELKPMPLHKVADLDKPLGYKGNYMMFPLKECTTVTDFMLLEYIDSYFGIRDPDALSEFTTEELTNYRRHLTDDEQEAMDRILALRFGGQGRETETIVMPTGNLYMEALVGSHTLLEPFKLAHRGYDAARAREGLRKDGLENLRLASRLLQDEPLLDDPDAETKIEVSGKDNVDVDHPTG